MSAMRTELEDTKQQLENAFQANSSVSDAEKEERKAMEKKLEEMEEKLKVFFPFLLMYNQTWCIAEPHCQQCSFSRHWNGK